MCKNLKDDFQENQRNDRDELVDMVARFYKFATKENVAVNTGCPGKAGAKGSCPTKAGLERMGELLASGGGKAQASMLMAGVGLLAVVAIGAAVMSKKKERSAQSQPRPRAV